MTSLRFLLYIVCIFVLCSYNLAKADNDFGIRGLKFKGTNLTTACELVKNADIGWYRGSVLWQNIVDEQGNFNWEDLDRHIKKILKYNIKIMLTLRSVHKLFAPGSGRVDLGYKQIWRSAPPAPEYVDDYKDFVRQVVERYDGDGIDDAFFISKKKNIKYWQIENEPGKKPDKGSNFWNGTATDYAELFLIAYDVIKEADSEAKVALSGFTHGAIKYYINNGDSFILEVLKILYERDGDFDIFDYHFYEPYQKFIKISNAIHSQLNKYTKFANKPVWVTETNVDKNDMDPYYTVEQYNRLVAKDIVKRYSTLFSNEVEKVFWFKLSDEKNATWDIPMEPSDFEQFRGLTKSDLTPKPVYYTYKLLIEKVKNKRKVLRVHKLEIDSYMYVYKYKFGKDKEPIYVMWYDNPSGESKEVQISLPWESVLITHVVTEPGVTEPYTEIRQTQNGILQVTLNDSPIFVEKY